MVLDAGGYNDNTETLCSMAVEAGDGAGSSNEDGTINTTTTTVNTTAGISISTYGQVQVANSNTRSWFGSST